MKMLLGLITCLLLATPTIGAPWNQNSGKPNSQAKSVKVCNRVVAIVNDEPITLLDVTKHLDLILAQHYPEYKDSPAMRYEFYQSQWQGFLDDIIENKLILAEANERGAKVTEGELHQEIERRYGPNVLHTIDEMGKSYDEVRKMVTDEMLVQKVTNFVVRYKAFSRITPAGIQEAYKAYLASTPETNEWSYYTVSIRGNSDESCEELAQRIVEACEKENVAFQDVVRKLAEEGKIPEGVQANLSNLFTQKDTELNDSYRAALTGLKPGELSAPQVHTKVASQPIYRIFSLTAHNIAKPKVFADVQEELRMQLFRKYVSEEATSFLTTLRTKYGVVKHTESILAGKPQSFFQLI